MMEALQVNPEVENVAVSLLGNGDLQIRKIATGRDSTSYKIESANGDYVLRTAGSKENYDVEHYILRLLKEKGIRVPVPVAESVDFLKYPFAFSLEEKLPGVSLAEAEKENWPQVIKEVGEQMAIVYDLKFPGFGSIDAKYFRKTGQIQGSKSLWSDYLLQSYDRRTDRVRKKFKADQKAGFIGSRLSNDQKEKLTIVVNNIDQVRDEILSARQTLDVKQGRLIHGDISAMHILVVKNKLSGILDFNDAKIGDPLYDIAIFSVGTKGDYYKDLMSGAALRFDENRFHLYRLMTSIWKLDIRYVRQNYLHQNPRILDTALEEIRQ